MRGDFDEARRLFRDAAATNEEFGLRFRRAQPVVRGRPDRAARRRHRGSRAAAARLFGRVRRDRRRHVGDHPSRVARRGRRAARAARGGEGTGSAGCRRGIFRRPDRPGSVALRARARPGAAKARRPRRSSWRPRRAGCWRTPSSPSWQSPRSPPAPRRPRRRTTAPRQSGCSPRRARSPRPRARLASLAQLMPFA